MVYIQNPVAISAAFVAFGVESTNSFSVSFTTGNNIIGVFPTKHILKTTNPCFDKKALILKYFSLVIEMYQDNKKSQFL